MKMHFFVFLLIFCRLVWTSWGCSPGIAVTGLSNSIEEVCAATVVHGKAKFNFTMVTDQSDISCANQLYSIDKINWQLYPVDIELSFDTDDANIRHGVEASGLISTLSQTGIYGLVAEVQFSNGNNNLPETRIAVIGYFISGCNGTYTNMQDEEQERCEEVYMRLVKNYDIEFCGTKKVHYGDSFCAEHENGAFGSGTDLLHYEANITFIRLTFENTTEKCEYGKDYFLTNQMLDEEKQNKCDAEFEICTKMKDIYSSCKDVHKKIPNAFNDVYSLENDEGDTYSVYCEFFPSHIYTYIAPTDLTTLNIDDLYNHRKEVMIRHKVASGDQFESTIKQIQNYKDRDISIQYNSNVGYNSILNTRLGPYLYIGLLPIANITYKNVSHGYNVNGKDFLYLNCDGNSNNYFTQLFNSDNNSFHVNHQGSPFVRHWENESIAVPSNRKLPDKFFSYYEIHFGGCGGLLATPKLDEVIGISIGIRYDNVQEPVLRCKNNCKPLANSKNRVRVYIECENCTSEIVSYDWSTGTCNSPTVVSCSSDIQHHVKKSSPSVFSFKVGNDWHFEDRLFQGIFVTVTFQNGQQVERHYIYRYSPIPTEGVCEMTPSTGYALITNFNITCVNFTVPDGFNLSYRMLSNKVDTVKKALKFYHGDENSKSGIKLQEGLSTDNNTLYIFVRVVVVDGVLILVRTNVQVLPLELTDDGPSAIDLVSSLTLGGTNGSNYVDDLFNSGDQDAAVQLIGIMSSTINNMNETGDNSSRELKTEVRSAMVSGLGKVNVSDFEALTTLTTVLNDVTDVKSELSEQAQDDATDLYDGLADSFDAFLSSSSSEEEITETSTLILQGVTGILDIVTDSGSKKLSYTSVSVLDPGDTIVEEDKEAINKVKNSTGKLLNTLNKLSGSILAQQFADEPPTILQTNTVTISVQKVSKGKLSGVPLSPSINSTSGVMFDEVLQGLTDVGIKMIEMNINPFIWDSSVRDVNSKVLTVDLNDDNGNKVTMSNLTSPLEISLNTPETTQTNTETLLYVNLVKTNGTVDYDHNKLNMIAFNFTLLKDKTVVLKLAPLSNITRFRVLISSQEQSGSLEDVLNFGFTYPDESHLQTQYTYFKYFNQNLSTVIENMNTGFVYFHHNSSNENVSPTIYLSLAIDINDTEVMGNLGSNVTECLANDTRLTCAIEVPIIVETKVLSCTYWDEEDQRWSSRGCEVSPYTTTDTLKCACTHLTSFAGGVFVLPNFVDPIGDAKLFLTFFDNPLVVTAVLVVWIVYFFLVHWARRADRIDKEKVGVIYCNDNDVTHRFSYLVCVVTGWWKEAGTTANAFIYIQGTKGASPRKKLSNTARLCFQTGYEDWFLVTVEENLGDIKQVTFWHDNTGTSPHWLTLKSENVFPFAQTRDELEKHKDKYQNILMQKKKTSTAKQFVHDFDWVMEEIGSDKNLNDLNDDNNENVREDESDQDMGHDDSKDNVSHDKKVREDESDEDVGDDDSKDNVSHDKKVREDESDEDVGDDDSKDNVSHDKKVREDESDEDVGDDDSKDNVSHDKKVREDESDEDVGDDDSKDNVSHDKKVREDESDEDVSDDDSKDNVSHDEKVREDESDEDVSDDDIKDNVSLDENVGEDESDEDVSDDDSKMNVQDNESEVDDNEDDDRDVDYIPNSEDEDDESSEEVSGEDLEKAGLPDFLKFIQEEMTDTPEADQSSDVVLEHGDPKIMNCLNAGKRPDAVLHYMLY